jgi:8-oxo-dGTP pyrophosphatase MutT (NUDIX family)
MTASEKPTDLDDSPFDPADPTRPARAPAPKDAATLILIRKGRQSAEVLMGQRSKGHVFMPDKWVFPGGRVDRTDALAPAATELAPFTEEKLRLQNRRRNPRAFALAAVRETFEEAGLIVGRRGRAGLAPAGWETYCAHDAAPELHKLAFVCRAITPPYRPRRFDARFFLADAEDVLLDDRPIAGDEELLHTRWFSFDEAEKLDLPSVTRFVIGEVRARLAGEETGGPPFLRWTRTGHRMDRL